MRFFFFFLSKQPLPVHCLINQWIGKEYGCRYLYDKPTKKGWKVKKHKQHLSETLNSNTNLHQAAERGSARWDPSARRLLSSASLPLHNTTQHNTRGGERREGVSASTDSQDFNASGRMNRDTKTLTIRAAQAAGIKSRKTTAIIQTCNSHTHTRRHTTTENVGF